jgi:hypothetical protein
MRELRRNLIGHVEASFEAYQWDLIDLIHLIFRLVVISAVKRHAGSLDMAERFICQSVRQAAHRPLSEPHLPSTPTDKLPS